MHTTKCFRRAAAYAFLKAPLTPLVLLLPHVFYASPCLAAITANSPDDICSPSDDPCVINQVVNVSTPELDFGLRKVVLTGSGRLRGNAVAVLCGAFVSDAGAGGTARAVEVDDFTLTARRGCSGDPSFPCVNQANCTIIAAGDCSVGDASITINGRVVARNERYGRGIDLRAAGNIDLSGMLKIVPPESGLDGGEIAVESYGGTLRSQARIIARSGAASYDYGAGYGGNVFLNAAEDVILSGAIDVWGAANGGEVNIGATRDILISGDIRLNAGMTESASGGMLGVYAERDIVLSRPRGRADTVLETNGGAKNYGAYGSSYWLAGYGGFQSLVADRDLVVGPGVTLRSSGGPAEGHAGVLWLYAGSKLSLSGWVLARTPGANGEPGQGGYGGYITLEANDGAEITRTGRLVTASLFDGGRVYMNVDGETNIDGDIDVRATGGRRSYSGGPPYPIGGGGFFWLQGRSDVTVSGNILGGGTRAASDLRTYACRMNLAPGGRIDSSHGSPSLRPGNNFFVLDESMVTQSGSKLIADRGGSNLIEYWNTRKPPVFEGKVFPEAETRSYHGGDGGPCSVCGNSEIDAGESCDDGDTLGGPWCTADCQDKGCLAATPGWPGTPLCYDANDCTIDLCDPLLHACSNPVSCEDDISCTVDSCNGLSCEHVPDDSLCDDRNDCTNDLCRATRGCLNAAISGNLCEDGDPCSPTGTCDRGRCITAPIRHANSGKLRLKRGGSAGEDRLSAKVEFSPSYFASNPSLVGMIAEILDRTDRRIFRAVLPAAGFESRSTGKFRFKSSAGDFAGLDGSWRVLVVKKSNAVLAKIKARDIYLLASNDDSVASLSILFGADPSVDDCVTARRMICRASSSSSSCKGRL